MNCTTNQTSHAPIPVHMNHPLAGHAQWTEGVADATQAAARKPQQREILVPESGVKIAISDLDRRQSVNLAQDAIGQIL
jgi:hypothetical protein